MKRIKLSSDKKKKEEISPDVMIIFWLKYKDHYGNLWFFPTDDWGVEWNLNCRRTATEFQRDLRAYVEASNK